jgi:hypothetical protein
MKAGWGEVSTLHNALERGSTFLTVTAEALPTSDTV